MESHPSSELENLVSTPSDVVYPFPSPSPDPLPPVQLSHMNTDQVPPFRKKMNTDQVQSVLAVAGEYFSQSNLTDRKIIESLFEVFQGSGFSRWDPFSMGPRQAVVNAGLPSTDPCGLPGIVTSNQGRREKNYSTDNHQVCNIFSREIKTPGGRWKCSGGASVIWATENTWVGLKRSFIWSVGENKSNWTMNVYNMLSDDSKVLDDLVLCHVFEGSPDHDFKPRERYRCSGMHSHEGSHAPTNASFSSNKAKLTSYMATLEGVLFGDPDPDPDSSMGLLDTEYSSPTRGVSPTDDHGHSNKRKKRTSDVWKYFTKIYARDLEGKVLTLAVCNHCSKVLTGSSTNGTTHLARHACPCKFKPVEAGRTGNGEVNVLSS